MKLKFEIFLVCFINAKLREEKKLCYFEKKKITVYQQAIFITDLKMKRFIVRCECFVVSVSRLES